MSQESVRSSNPYDLPLEQTERQEQRNYAAKPPLLEPPILYSRPDRPHVRSWFTWTASASTLTALFRRMGISLRAGIDVRRVLEGEAARGMPAQRSALETIRQHVASGGDFSEGVRESGWFPELACDLIEMGEHAGRLDECLLRLADHYEHQVQLRRQFLGAIAFPMIQLFLSIAVVAGAIWLIGSFSNGEMTVLGLGGSSGAMTFLTFTALVLGGIGATIYALTTGWFGTIPLRIAMKTPVIGTAMEAFALSRFAWALHSGLEAAMPAKRSVELAFRSAQNPVYVEQTNRALADVGMGRELHEALSNTGVFPTMFMHVVENGEVSGTLGTALPRLSADYEDIGRRNAVMAAMAAGYAVWMAVAAFIISMIFSLANNYLNVLNNAGNI